MSEETNIEREDLPKRNPYTVWFVIIAFVGPVVLAYVMFYFVEVKSFTNKGELFNPLIRIENLGLKDETGQVIPQDKLTYKWRMYSFVGADCDDACKKRLFEVRQLHKTLGKNRHRIYQAIVYLDPPGEPLKKLINDEIPEALIMYGDERKLIDVIKNNVQIRQNEIYFQDPRGNIMMRFTQDQPIKDVRHDLTKLLKASQIG